VIDAQKLKWKLFFKMNIENLTDEQIKVISELSCPEADGFEGPDTFPSCGKCIVCLCRNRLKLC